MNNKRRRSNIATDKLRSNTHTRYTVIEISPGNAVNVPTDELIKPDGSLYNHSQLAETLQTAFNAAHNIKAAVNALGLKRCKPEYKETAMAVIRAQVSELQKALDLLGFQCAYEPYYGDAADNVLPAGQSRQLGSF